MATKCLHPCLSVPSIRLFYSFTTDFDADYSQELVMQPALRVSQPTAQVMQLSGHSRLRHRARQDTSLNGILVEFLLASV